MNEWFTVLAERLAVGDIVIGELLGGGQSLLLSLGHGVVGHLRQYAAHGADRIDGGGACLSERAVNLRQVSFECLESTPPKGSRALSQAVGRRGADRAGSANDHVGDGEGGIAKVRSGDDFEFVREQSLLNEPDAISRRVKPNGAVMPRLALVGNLHDAGRGLVVATLEVKLVANLLEAWIGADLVQVRILVHPLRIVVAELNSLSECSN